MNETRTTTQTQATIDRLLDAAIQVIAEGGAQRLTLDAVAKKAGVSKGGLLHHFPSKNALIAALLERLYARFEALTVAYYEAEAEQPGRWLRAYIRASFDPDAPQIGLELTALLATYLHEDDALVQRAEKDSRLWAERLTSDGVSAVRAALIRYTCDGYFTERLISQPDTLVSAADLRDALLALVEDVS
jgi:AcrR family transcriptional regulator